MKEPLNSDQKCTVYLTSDHLCIKLGNLAEWLERGKQPEWVAQELRFIAKSIAAKAPPGKNFKARLQDVKVTKAGDIWIDRRSGKRVTVTGREGMNIKLQHEDGRATVKWGSYLACSHILEIPS